MKTNPSSHKTVIKRVRIEICSTDFKFTVFIKIFAIAEIWQYVMKPKTKAKIISLIIVDCELCI